MDEDKYTDKQVCDILSNNHFSNLLQYVLHMFGTMPRSMTEEEIVQYLKMNKNIGIVFKFMPEEVKNWSSKHSEKLCWYDVDCWINGGTEKRLYDDKIYALSEDFKMEENLKGEWIEFEIDEDGYFCYIAESERDEHCKFYYSWWSWQKFLDDNRENLRVFTAFGGWQYEGSERWYLAPAVKLKDGDYWNSYVIEVSGEATPVKPVKIRFWKEYK